MSSVGKAASGLVSPATQLNAKGSPAVGSTTPGAGEQDHLRAAVQQLEGLFVEQLFKAMRETVPQGGLASGGSGEEIFSGLLDQHLSAEVPAGWGKAGLGEVLYRQLSQRIQGPETAPAPPPANK